MSIKAYILPFLAYISLASSGLAPFITKCKWDDSKCLQESSQKAIMPFANGIPELNMEKLDPLHLKYVDATTSNLKLIVTDATVTGLKNCEIKQLQREIEHLKILMKIQCAVDLTGTYDMKGQLFVLPIEGNGKLITKVPKMVINVEVNTNEKTGKDGKKHWNVKSYKHTFELKDKSDVKFDNLFPENEFLRNTTNDLIAKNGNDVITEIGQPMINTVVGKVIESVKKFFNGVPVEDLALE